MALPSVLHHFDVTLSDVDRGVHETFAVKAARHPSETVERLWLRLLAYCWRHEEGIVFGPGLCEPDAPDLLANRLDGTPSLVVRVGAPAPDRVERDVNARGGAKVAVLFESPRRMEAFLEEARGAGRSRLARVDLAAVEPAFLRELAGEGDRRVKVTITIAADHLYVDRGGRTLDAPLIRASF